MTDDHSASPHLAETHTPAVDIHNVTVRYANVTALENISLSIPPQQIVGLLGMNGAGKSSLFSALMNLTRIESGHIQLFGREIKQALTANLVAYVPQSENVDWDFPVSVRDVVMMGRYGTLGITRRPRPTDHHAVKNALERVGLTPLQNRQIGQLSGGQRKRTFIARAIAQDAQLLLLDEPFAGVDTASQTVITTLLHQLRTEKRSILISTHDLTGVPTLCDRVVLLQRRILFDGPPHEALTPHRLASAFEIPT
jgi:manganese transport system ATP-binding protein